LTAASAILGLSIIIGVIIGSLAAYQIKVADTSTMARVSKTGVEIIRQGAGCIPKK
jgi:ABC-type dipeptide/oligopeptide/nickel transport system permease subunit